MWQYQSLDPHEYTTLVERVVESEGYILLHSFGLTRLGLKWAGLPLFEFELVLRGPETAGAGKSLQKRGCNDGVGVLGWSTVRSTIKLCR